MDAAMLATLKCGARYVPAEPDFPAGRPKGVCVTNANVCHYARAFANEFHPCVGDVMLQYSVCSFDIFVEEVFATLLNGAAIAIPPPNARRI